MNGNASPTEIDRLLGFSIPGRDARGRIVRLGPALDTILAAHDYPPAIKHLLAEALALTALMGGLLKREGSQLTMQAQTDGGVVPGIEGPVFSGGERGRGSFSKRTLSRSRGNRVVLVMIWTSRGR